MLGVTANISLGTASTVQVGPADITLVDSKSSKPKKAQFPHRKHQKDFACAECHHGMADGKKIPYTEGQKIQKCTVCHNAKVLGGKKKGKFKLDTFKGAGHGKCLTCHKSLAKKDPNLKKKKIAKCATCHPKKKR